MKLFVTNSKVFSVYTHSDYTEKIILFFFFKSLPFEICNSLLNFKSVCISSRVIGLSTMESKKLMEYVEIKY